MTRDSFDDFEATSLFCPRCRRATPARKKLLLVLPTGNKFGKTDNDPRDFYRAAPPGRAR